MFGVNFNSDEIFNKITEIEAENSKADSAVKRKIAVNFLMSCSYIKQLPFHIREFIAGLIVDFTVSAFNWIFGHEWFDKKKESINESE